MKIEDIRALPGPNVWVHRPVLVMRLDLEELTEKESFEIEGFNERLLAALPGLNEHHCAKGRPGGFVERLRDGTYFGHVVEHVTLELSQAAGVAVNFGKARYAGAPGLYNVIVEYKAEQGMRFLLRTAVELVSALVRGDSFPLAERVEEAKRVVRRTEFGPSARGVVDAAEARGIPWARLDGGSLLQLGYGRHRRYIRATGETGPGGVEVVSDEDLDASLLTHRLPSESGPRDAGAAVVGALFPEGSDGRVPVISVTGTNGRTNVTRMIEHALAASGLCVGTATTDGIRVGGERIAGGDADGPVPARIVLSDRSVELAVLETTCDGIVRHGLGYDWSDIGVLTNVGPDDIEWEGVESVEDIVWIMSLVAERVREGGTLVLNADDAHLARLAEAPRVHEPRRRIVYFSLDHTKPLLRGHTAAGGTGYFVRDGVVFEAEGGQERGVVGVSDVAAARGGDAEFQPANVLAATAACRAYGLTREQCAAAWRSFRDEV
ncbi:MAG TPA: Mur ligase family protein [Pyrinomonadaceae bacterium]|nr:Mur ligase family protein [Pyrinomonadaceae bacterium]